jgi:hypothetical protein
MPIPCMTQMVGTMAGGIMRPVSTMKLATVPILSRFRCSTYPAMEHTATISTIEKSVMATEFPKARITMPLLVSSTVR